MNRPLGAAGHRCRALARALLGGAALLLGATTCGGCALVGAGSARASLTKALEAHAESVRWGGTQGLENSSGSRITDFEVRSVKFADDAHTRAHVRVEVQGYAYPRMALQRWYVEQTWVERGDSWVVVGERELKTPARPQGRSTLGSGEPAERGSGVAR